MYCCCKTAIGEGKNDAELEIRKRVNRSVKSAATAVAEMTHVDWKSK